MNDILGDELEMRFQAAFAGSALLAWPQPPPNASGRGSGCSPTERPMPTTGSFSEKSEKNFTSSWPLCRPHKNPTANKEIKLTWKSEKLKGVQTPKVELGPEAQKVKPC